MFFWQKDHLCTRLNLHACIHAQSNKLPVEDTNAFILAKSSLIPSSVFVVTSTHFFSIHIPKSIPLCHHHTTRCYIPALAKLPLSNCPSQFEWDSSESHLISGGLSQEKAAWLTFYICCKCFIATSCHKNVYYNDHYRGSTLIIKRGEVSRIVT